MTRLKQCHLKQLTHLQSFGKPIVRREEQRKTFFHSQLDQPGYHHAFETTHVKRRIALYQLKQSQLDFRLMIKSEHTGEFLDMGIYCRSSPLLESESLAMSRMSSHCSLIILEEGIGYKRSTKEE